MTRESKRVDAHDQEIQQASELNAKLQAQLKTKEEALRKKEDKIAAEVLVFKPFLFEFLNLLMS